MIVREECRHCARERLLGVVGFVGKGGSMLETGGIYIIGVTGVIGFILCAGKLKFLFDFFCRASVGAVCIYGINSLLSLWGVATVLGINWASLLCAGFLGIPGVIAMYGLAVLECFKI